MDSEDMDPENMDPKDTDPKDMDPKATDSEACGTSPESRSFILDAIEYLQDMVNREDLQRLLNEDEAWEAFVAVAELSRDEAHKLWEALKRFTEDSPDEDKDRLQKARQKWKMFLERFPQVQRMLEGHIRKIRELADHVDAVHKGCAITEVVTDSTSIASGVLGILGIFLAPMTAGTSLALTATGIGLRAASAVTSVISSIVEGISNEWATGEASCLVSTCSDILEDIAKVVVGKVPASLFSNVKSFYGLKDLGKNICAMKVARNNPRLVAEAKILMTTKGVSPQSAREVKEALKGTTLAMTRGARVLSAATAGFFLLLDVIGLVKDSQHLQEGAKAELAEALQCKAEELERTLTELIQIYESLQSDLSP